MPMAIMLNEYDYRASMDCARKEGIVDGLLQAAKSMLKDGLDPARVARITELPKKQIMALKRSRK